jgi:hypothetical protein
MAICVTSNSKNDGTNTIKVIFKMTMMIMVIILKIIMRNVITCTTNCNHRITATLCTLGT